MKILTCIFSGILASVAILGFAAPALASGDTWTTTGSVNQARFAQVTTLLSDGRVLMAGGQCCSSTHFGIKTVNNMEVYDPGTGLWTLSGSTDLDYVKKVVSLPNGQVLVGGYNGYYMFGDGFHPMVQIYDPATGIWTATSTPGSDLGSSYVIPSWWQMLYSAHVIPLADSRILFIASCSVDGTAAGIIYDPTANSWTSAGPCADNIALGDSYTATLLSNGKVTTPTSSSRSPTAGRRS